MKSTVTITAPHALPNERVNVLNYRCRPPRWERGTCGQVEFVIYAFGEGQKTIGDGAWKYQVWTDRLSGGKYPRPITLTVGDESIEGSRT